MLWIRSVSSYTKKAATKNIRVLALCSNDLLKALADLFIDSQHEKCSYLKVFHDIFTFFYFPFLVLLRCRFSLSDMTFLLNTNLKGLN